MISQIHSIRLNPLPRRSSRTDGWFALTNSKSLILLMRWYWSGCLRIYLIRASWWSPRVIAVLTICTRTVYSGATLFPLLVFWSRTAMWFHWTMVLTIDRRRSREMEITISCGWFEVDENWRKRNSLIIFYLSFHRINPENNDANDSIDTIFKILCSQENDIIRAKTFTHFGRNLSFNKTCGQILDSSFTELCDRVSG